MSLLKDILVELHNCVYDYDETDPTPNVWSRDFQKKLALNADHWNSALKNPAHLDADDYRQSSENGGEMDDHFVGAIDYVTDFDQFDDSEFDDYNFSEFDFDSSDDLDFSNFDSYEEVDCGCDEYCDCDCECHSDNDYNYDYSYDYEEDCEDEGGPLFKNFLGFEMEEEEEESTDPSQKVGKLTNVTPLGGKGEEENPDDKDPINQMIDDQYGEDNPNDDEDSVDFGDEFNGDGEWDDPDYQGVIRHVPRAHLVHKRQQEDGTFNELWIYNIGNDFKKELKIRRAILAGTDIPINKMRSPDNTQSYEIWTAGNAQMMMIKGLPN